MTPALSIAVVLYNSADVLTDCLRSIRGEVADGLAELIAVDNASPDDSAAIVERELPQARLVRAGQNAGFAAGVNAALSEASGRYCLLLNPDVRVPPGALRLLVSWMDAHPSIGAASPDIVGNDGEWESPGRALPSIWRSVLELSRIHRLLPKRLRGKALRGSYWIGGDQLDAGWIPATAMIVRQAAVHAAGPMRENFFMYGEDIEWCWRMQRSGWRIGVCAATTFTHHRSSSMRRSWGEQETQRRIAAGINAACREIRGGLYARVNAGLTALALLLESVAPRRSAADREQARRIAAIWRTLALNRSSGRPDAREHRHQHV